MSEQLMLPDGVDKLSLPQKVVALGLAGTAAYFILPTVISIMLLTWYTLLLGIPLVFLAYNYQVFWNGFKTLSWKVTESLIGLDVLGYMDRYLDWVHEQGKVLKSSRNVIAQQLQGVETEISTYEKSYNDHMKDADASDKLIKQGKTEFSAQLQVALENAAVDKDFIATMVPIRREAKESLEYMDELITVFDSKEKTLDYNIKAQKSKYKTLRAMAKGLRAGALATASAGHQHKIWQATNDKLIQQMNQFTVSIESSKKMLQPALEKGRLDKQIRDTEGMKLLQEFRKANFQLAERN